MRMAVLQKSVESGLSSAGDRHFGDSLPPAKKAFAAGSACPDMVVTSGDWPKVWTRAKGPRKEIVVTGTLITTCGGWADGQKAASQAGFGLRLRNIFRKDFITASRKPWDGLGISEKGRF
jgi:hypothetical protein